jgi:uncharacterized protein (TIGR02246 family)
VTSNPVQDELAIRDLAARFTDAVNRRDPEAVGRTFADDGEWVVPGLPLSVGPQAAEKQIAGLLESFAYLVQLLHSGLVEVDGDVATASWYLTENASDGSTADFTFVGVYRDELRRGDDGWQFARREFSFLRRAKGELQARCYPHPAVVGA